MDEQGPETASAAESVGSAGGRRKTGCSGAVESLGGLRESLFRAYSPVTATKWVEFVKDCGAVTVTTVATVNIFDASRKRRLERLARREAKERRQQSLSSRRSGDAREEVECGPSRRKARETARDAGEELTLDEFGCAVHKLAHHVYDRTPGACAKFGYLHLLPLASRGAVPFHVISFAERALVRWREAKETKAGLQDLFNRFAQRGGQLTMKGWQSLLRSTGVFPEHLTLVALQDAFFETLLECAWEDPVCNAVKEGPILKLALNLALFVECLCRAFTKATCFRPGGSASALVRLMDQFLFPRRFLRMFKRAQARKQAPARDKRQLACASDTSSEFENSDGEDEDCLSVHSLSSSASNAPATQNAAPGRRGANRRERPTVRREPGTAAERWFQSFVDSCTDPDKRKVARLELLEFIRSGGLGRAERAKLSSRGALVGAGAPLTRALSLLSKPQRELELNCIRVEQAVQANQLRQEGRRQRSSCAQQPRGKAPSGFVSAEEHSVVLTKLQALEEALDIGGIGDLDWDGTLDDAEAKMKDLLPGLMSDDAKEQMEAQNKFEVLDRIVRNHKDYKDRERKKKEKWEEENLDKNRVALEELQAIFPQCIAQGTAMHDLTEVFKLPPALAKRVFQRKALRIVHMDQAEIARMHVADLTGTFSTQGLDLRELRAVYSKLPAEFGADGDGKKGAWKEGVLSQLQALVKKAEDGTLPKHQAINPAYSARVPGDGTASSDAGPSPAPSAPPRLKLMAKTSSALASKQAMLAAMLGGDRRAPMPPVEPVEPSEDDSLASPGSHRARPTRRTTVATISPQSPMEALKVALAKRRASLPPEIRGEEAQPKVSGEKKALMRLARSSSISAIVRKCQEDDAGADPFEECDPVISMCAGPRRCERTDSTSSGTLGEDEEEEKGVDDKDVEERRGAAGLIQARKASPDNSPTSPQSLLGELNAVLRMRSLSSSQ